MQLGTILTGLLGFVLIAVSITEKRRGKVNRVLCFIGGILLFIMAGVIYLINKAI